METTETTTTVTESVAPSPDVIVAPVIVTPQPDETTTVQIVERLTRLEGTVLEMGTGTVRREAIDVIERRIAQLETMLAETPLEETETETVTEVVPTPLPETAIEKPKRARGPIAAFLLGKSV